MGNYQDSYTTVLALLQQDIQGAKAELDGISEDQEEPRAFQRGLIRGLEWAVKNLEVNQPVK